MSLSTALLAAALTVPAQAAQAAQAAQFNVDSILVKYAQGVRPADVLSAAEAANDLDVELKSGRFVGFGYRLVNLNDEVDIETAEQVARDLSDLPGVLAAEPDMPIALARTQNSPPWGLDRVDQRALPLNGVYNYGESTGAGTRVYIVDTGVRGTHSQFSGRIVPGFSPFDSTQGLQDCNGHGTHVAGTAAGSTYGVAKAATIVPVRVFSCAGFGSVSDAISALSWIVSTNLAGTPGVVNMSLTVVNQSNQETTNSLLDSAVQSTINAGFTVVVAAGNTAKDACDVSPSRVLAGITVNASTRNDARANFSNFGTCTDVFAPGVDVESASYLSDTSAAISSGTSMAAPHVAGVVARLLQAQPSLSPAQVQALLLDEATNMTVGGSFAGDPARLLFAATVEPPPPPPATPGPAPLPAQLNPGQGAVFVDGQPLNAKVSRNSLGTGVSIEASDFSLDISGLGADGSPRPLASTGVLQVSPGRGIASRGSGFAPGSRIGVYLDPPIGATTATRVSTTSLGEVTVAANGSFVVDVDLPLDLSVGAHVLQIVGASPAAAVRAIALGVSVVNEIPDVGQTILVQGSRQGRSVRVVGGSTGLTGERLVAMVQLPGERGHSVGRASPLVTEDGTFTWQRRTGKKLAVFFRTTDESTRSARVVIQVR